MKVKNYIFEGYDKLEEFINKNNINKESNVLIQMFSGYLDKEFLIKIRKFFQEKLPNASLIGTTTDGEIISNYITEQKIVLSFSIFEKTKLETFCFDLEDDGFEAGVKLAKIAVKDNTKVMIVFADGLKINGNSFLRGFSSINNKILIAGGLAGDNSNFINTYVFNEKYVSDNGVAAVSLNSEDLIFHNIYGFGWKPVGKRFIITKSEKNCVYEVNNKPVIEIFKKYLGKEISTHLPKIGIEIPFVMKKNEHLLARAVVGKNSDNSLIFAGDMPEGSEVRFSVADSIALIEDALNYFNTLEDKEISSIFVYSCMARKKVLNNEATDEIKILNKKAPTSGFFTYGEFYSFGNSDGSYRYDLFNETTTVLTLFEKGVDKFSKLNINVEEEIPKELYLNHCTALKKALTHFVDVTTSELEELNAELEERVQKEVEINLQTQKILMQQTKQAQMGEMLSMIAHQWRQPLNAIATSVINLSLMNQLDTMKEDTIESTSEFVQNQVQKMSKIIDSFIGFAKPETKKSIFYSNKMLEGALEIMQAQLKNRAIDLKLNFQAAQICGYQTLLEQVIINLIANARDAFELNNIDDRKIEIVCKKESNQLIIEVEDNAGGIPKNVQDRIFNPYFTTKGANGTGLGLYMSKDIMKKQFDGDLKFEVIENKTKFFIIIGEKALNLEECNKV